MWNIRRIETPSNSPVLEAVHPERVEPITLTSASTCNQSTIGKGWVIKGEITGTESVFIDGCVEGTINLPGNLVTLGPNSQVTATISARNVVVRGSVQGEVVASNRLEIRAEGAVTGTVNAARLCIEEGAFINCGVNNLLEESGPAVKTGSAANPMGTSKTHLVGPSKAAKVLTEQLPMSA